MLQPMISVIVPVYNTAKYLRRCVDSILAQTYRDFELLLIDDGSTDASGTICDEYAALDSRVRVFHKPNGGVSSARNLGLDSARGQWITFADSDDRVDQRWLANFDLNRNEKFELICQGYTGTTAQGLTTEYIYSGSGSPRDLLQALFDNKIAGYIWCKAFKTEIIEENDLRFNDKFNVSEDLEFELRYISKINKILCSDKIGYYYSVPDYGIKYTVKQEIFDLALSIYASLRTIGVNKKNWISVWSREKLCSALMINFCNKESDAVRKLKIFREELGTDIFKTKLFFMTKTMIWLDFTSFLSSIIIKIHCNIKKGRFTY